MKTMPPSVLAPAPSALPPHQRRPPCPSPPASPCTLTSLHGPHSTGAGAGLSPCSGSPLSLRPAPFPRCGPRSMGAGTQTVLRHGEAGAEPGAARGPAGRRRGHGHHPAAGPQPPDQAARPPPGEPGACLQGPRAGGGGWISVGRAIQNPGLPGALNREQCGAQEPPDSVSAPNLGHPFTTKTRLRPQGPSLCAEEDEGVQAGLGIRDPVQGLRVGDSPVHLILSVSRFLKMKKHLNGNIKIIPYFHCLYS